MRVFLCFVISSTAVTWMVAMCVMSMTNWAAAALTYFSSQMGRNRSTPLRPALTAMTWPAWFQALFVSTKVLVNPDHWATWLLDNSNHMWHECSSSSKKICFSPLLQGSLLDQLLKKLPLTDSRSVNATTWRPSDEGHHNSVAIKSASI